MAPVTPGETGVNPLAATARACCTKGRLWEAQKAKRGDWRNFLTCLHRVTLAGQRNPMDITGESVRASIARHRGIQRLPNARLEFFQLRDFADPDLCRALVTLIDSRRRPSTIADAGDDTAFRTSETCDLSADEPAVARIEALFAELSGIDPAFGEPLQGQRYDVGQEFKPHTDYFNRGGKDWDAYCSVAAQRTWTFMVYLNDVPAGGATRFTAIGKTVQPEAGKLLCWNNLYADGRGNPDTIHHGMKVRSGVKYIITKWYREQPWGRPE